MDEWQVMINFMKDSVHLREIGAALAICGAPVAGYFFKRFMYIGQLGGRRGDAGLLQAARNAGPMPARPRVERHPRIGGHWFEHDNVRL